MLFDYFFPKIDIDTKQLGQIISDYKKNKFLIHDETCYICNKKSKSFLTHKFCNNDIKQVVVCFYYTKEIKKYLLGFKYYHRKNIVNDFSYIMNFFYEIYFSKLDKEKTVLTYIPMHWIRKYFIKGYNQGELLANNLGNLLNIKVINICKKIKYTKPQAKIKKREKRLQNINGTFLCKELKDIENVVIIDDIITTGSTIKELAKEIKKQNPKINIYSLVLARK